MYQVLVWKTFFSKFTSDHCSRHYTRKLQYFLSVFVTEASLKLIQAIEYFLDTGRKTWAIWLRFPVVLNNILDILDKQPLNVCRSVLYSKNQLGASMIVLVSWCVQVWLNQTHRMQILLRGDCESLNLLFTAMNQKANKHAHYHACSKRNKMKGITKYEYWHLLSFLFLL